MAILREMQTDPNHNATARATVRALLLLIACSLLMTCSNRAIYNSIQQDGRRLCEQKPIPTQKACREQYDTSFDEYERERSALLRENGSPRS